jgi:murein DD-endopeptidase MepM/ murein hydrolase activator NlpD
MAQKTTNRPRQGAKKWLDKYRLLVQNEDTHEEKFSLTLNRLNVLLLVSLGSFLLILITTVVIAFTPLREYIPGYASTSLRRQAVKLSEQTDSLQQALAQNNLYLTRVIEALRGDLPLEQVTDTLFLPVPSDSIDVDLSTIAEDSLLRAAVAFEDRVNVFPAPNAGLQVFYPPASGPFSSAFEPEHNHWALDITAEPGSPVKSVAQGTVVFADWTTNQGYVLVVEHQDRFISVYKHCGTLLKSQSDRVKAGEAIATVGNTGTLSTGPHLHFELWKDGAPVNPNLYIDFAP